MKNTMAPFQQLKHNLETNWVKLESHREMDLYIALLDNLYNFSQEYYDYIEEDYSNYMYIVLINPVVKPFKLALGPTRPSYKSIADIIKPYFYKDDQLDKIFKTHGVYESMDYDIYKYEPLDNDIRHYNNINKYVYYVDGSERTIEYGQIKSITISVDTYYKLKTWPNGEYENVNAGNCFFTLEKALEALNRWIKGWEENELKPWRDK